MARHTGWLCKTFDEQMILAIKNFFSNLRDVSFPKIAGNTGKAVGYNHSTGLFEPIDSGGSPGGGDTQVQFNNSDVFSGDSGFTYDGSGIATLSTALVVSEHRPPSNSSLAWKVANAEGTLNFLAIDTINKRVAINSSPAHASLLVTRQDFGSGIRIESNGYTTNAIEGTISGSVRFSISYDGRFNTSIGSKAAPAYSFFGDSDTGLYAPGSDQLALSAGGDPNVWVTTSGVALGHHAVISPTAKCDVAGSTTSHASLRLRDGVDPISPNDGDIWQDGTDVKVRVGGITYTLDKTAV